MPPIPILVMNCGLCNCPIVRICPGELVVVVVMVCQTRGMCVEVLLVGSYGNAKDNDNNMLWCSHNNTITPPCAIIITTSLQSQVKDIHTPTAQQMPPPKTRRQRTIQVPPGSGGRCDGRRKGCGRKFNINTIIIIPHLQSHLLISSHSTSSSLSPWSSNTRHAEEGCNLIGFNRYTHGGSLRKALHGYQRWMDKAGDAYGGEGRELCRLSWGLDIVEGKSERLTSIE